MSVCFPNPGERVSVDRNESLAEYVKFVAAPHPDAVSGRFINPHTQQVTAPNCAAAACSTSSASSPSPWRAAYRKQLPKAFGSTERKATADYMFMHGMRTGKIK